jgi:hypothetical protein
MIKLILHLEDYIISHNVLNDNFSQEELYFALILMLYVFSLSTYDEVDDMLELERNNPRIYTDVFGYLGYNKQETNKTKRKINNFVKRISGLDGKQNSPSERYVRRKLLGLEDL